MSYADDMIDAMLDGMEEGEDPYMFWADQIAECEAKGHGTWKRKKFQREDGSTYMAEVCQSCDVVLPIHKPKKSE